MARYSPLEESYSKKKNLDWHLLKRLYYFSRPYRRFMLGSFAFLPAVAFFHLIQPMFIREVVDSYISVGITQGLWLISLLFLGALGFEFLSRYFQIYLIELAGQKISYYLRKKIFSHIQSRSAHFFDKNSVGRLVTRLTTDVEHVSDLFSSGIIALFSDLIVLIGIIGLLLWLNWQLALITFCIFPILIALSLLFRTLSRRIYRVIRSKLATMSSHIQESLLGMNVIQLFVQERKMEDKFKTINEEHRKAHFMSNIYDAIFYASIEMMCTVTLALVLWQGAGGILKGALTFGTLVAFIDYIYKFFVPIRDLGNKFSLIQSAFTSCERIFSLLDNPEKIPEVSTPKYITQNKGKITFRNVSFGYKHDLPVLKDLSFEIHPGEKVALVGATGSGKTTLVKLLNRTYDLNKGQILIDDLSIDQLSVKDLRRHIGVVLQDISLFSSTIEQNIKLGFPHITDQKMKEAANAVRADHFIERLPHGYQHHITEGGANLSHGERQLISFARVLAYNPKILILDEATSSIDTETEKWIQEALHKIMKGRTCIVIAHRLSTIRDVDRILVLHKGELKESGTHQELIQLNGIYRKLYDLQFKSQEKTPELAHFIAGNGEGP